jgi:hypothetical protein
VRAGGGSTVVAERGIKPASAAELVLHRGSAAAPCALSTSQQAARFARA